MSFLRLATFLSLLPAMAHAQCEGASLAERLSPAQAAELAIRTEAIANPSGLFWQATRNNAEIIIIGTVHIWDQRLEALATEARPYLDGAALALFEMTADEQARLVEEVARDPSITTLDPGHGLNETLPPEEWEALAQMARDHGIPPFAAARMRPWFLATTLATPACALDAMQEGLLGLDFMLMETADAMGMEMRALEPWDTVLTLLDDLGPDGEIALLRSALIAPGLEEEMFVALLDSYFARDVAEIWEMNRIVIEEIANEDTIALMEETEEALIAVRNQAWLPVIEDAARSGTRIIVAAGAGHLPGDEGIVSLLAANGWTIRRLDN